MEFVKKSFFKRLIMITLILCFFIPSSLSVKAVNDPNSSFPNTSSSVSSQSSESPQNPGSSAISSNAPKDNSVPSSNYQPPTVSSQPVANYQAQSPAYSVYSPPVVYNSSSESESSSSEPESEISLPEVSNEDISLPYVLASSGASADSNKLLGIIAWSCIGLGIAIVLVVLFSGRRAHKGYVPRKRYKSSFNRKKKKLLLSDNYYRNIKKK